MENGWTQYIVKALISLLLAAALHAFSARRPPDPQGWRHVRPGPTYQLGIGLGLALTLLMAYIWLWVGSSRPDGEAQMRILFWLIIAFGSCTLLTLIQYRQVRLAAIRWRGDVIVWHRRDGRVEMRRLSQVTNINRSFAGATTAYFDDGASLWIDPNATNAEALIEVFEAEAGNRL